MKTIQVDELVLDGTGAQVGGTPDIDQRDATGFAIWHAESGLVLTSRVEGEPLGLAAWTGSAGQLWRFVPLRGGYFQIVSVQSSRVLDVAGVSRTSGSPLVTWGWNGGGNQQWMLAPEGDGGEVVIEARHSEMFLAVGSHGKGGPSFLGQWARGEASALLWHIMDCSQDDKPAENVSAPLMAVPDAPAPEEESEGKHAVRTAQQSLEFDQTLRVLDLEQAADLKVLDSRNKPLVVVANLQNRQVVTVTPSRGQSKTSPYRGDPSQQWHISCVVGSYYRLESATTGRVLSLRTSSSLDKLEVIDWVYQGLTFQHWKLVPLGRGVVRIESRFSDKVLEALGVGSDEERRLVQRPWENRPAQKWLIAVVVEKQPETDSDGETQNAVDETSETPGGAVDGSADDSPTVDDAGSVDDAASADKVPSAEASAPVQEAAASSDASSKDASSTEDASSESAPPAKRSKRTKSAKSPEKEQRLPRAEKGKEIFSA